MLRASGPLDRLPQLLARHARYTDLTIVGQADLAAHGVDDTALIEAAFMDSGRPALVIPRAGAAVLPPRRAIVAWDGSREAARAASDAMPLLQLGRAGRWSWWSTPRRRPAGDHAGRRARGPPGPARGQGRAAAGARAAAPHRRASCSAQARDEAADLLVMGGYGHSRLREMMLGGTTRSILEQTTIPVLLAH